MRMALEGAPRHRNTGGKIRAGRRHTPTGRKCRRAISRKKAIEILGDIGTQSSIDLMSPWIPVFDEFHVKREVQEAIKKIVKRNQ